MLSKNINKNNILRAILSKPAPRYFICMYNSITVLNTEMLTLRNYLMMSTLFRLTCV